MEQPKARLPLAAALFAACLATLCCAGQADERKLGAVPDPEWNTFLHRFETVLAEMEWDAFSTMFAEDARFEVGIHKAPERASWTREMLMEAYRSDRARQGYRRTRRICATRRQDAGVEITSAIAERRDEGDGVRLFFGKETFRLQVRSRNPVIVSGTLVAYARDALSAGDVAQEEPLTRKGLRLVCSMN